MSDTQQFNFDRVVDRHGSWCTQWDFVADRFGQDDLLPFTISDMDIPTAPAVIEALQQRVSHGVLGYSRWQHDDSSVPSAAGISSVLRSAWIASRLFTGRR